MCAIVICADGTLSVKIGSDILKLRKLDHTEKFYLNNYELLGTWSFIEGFAGKPEIEKNY